MNPVTSELTPLVDEECIFVGSVPPLLDWRRTGNGASFSTKLTSCFIAKIIAKIFAHSEVHLTF